MMQKIKRLYFGLVQRIKRIKYSLHKNNIYVFMFHDVYEVSNKLHTLDISKENFIKFIEYLQVNDIKIVSIDKVFINDKVKKCVLTFDDVYESVILNAIPVLNKLNIPYTLFISPCFIDKEGYIKSSQINELKKNPLCTIGFHTNNHKIMRELNDKEIEYEIDNSAFEKGYGVKCEYFAYPYGSVYACSKKVIKHVSCGKFKGAFSTINSSSNAKTNKKCRYFMSRINVCESTFNKVLQYF